MVLELRVNTPYDFARSIQDYGWIALAPCRWLDAQAALQRVERLSSGLVILLHLTSADYGEDDDVRVVVDIHADRPLSPAEHAELTHHLRWMLRLDDDLSGFYAQCAQAHDATLLAKVMGRGRLLRSPTLFEDVVKTICTTNTTWTQTKGMVERLVQRLGDPFPPEPRLRAFPTPEQVAAAGEEVFREELRLGYRGPYVLQLARDILEGRRDLEALKTAELPIKELRRTLKGIKGVGDYAANTLLMVLGHYEFLAVDSEMHNFVSKQYFGGRPVTEKEIQALYAPWGEWKYLAYWFELLWPPIAP